MPQKELYECENCESVYILTVIDTTYDRPIHCPCCGEAKVEKIEDPNDL